MTNPTETFFFILDDYNNCDPDVDALNEFSRGEGRTHTQNNNFSVEKTFHQYMTPNNFAYFDFLMHFLTI